MIERIGDVAEWSIEKPIIEVVTRSHRLRLLKNPKGYRRRSFFYDLFVQIQKILSGMQAIWSFELQSRITCQLVFTTIHHRRVRHSVLNRHYILLKRRHRRQQRLRQRLQSHQLLRLRQSPRQEQGNQRQNPRQGQQILKPEQQRQEQQRQDPKQNQNLSRRLRHRRQRHLGLHQIMLRHRQIQKQRSHRQLQRQAAILSRMFPTRHPVFSRRLVIEYSIM